MKLVYPQVHTDSKQKVFVSFYIQKKRYRLYNGKRIGSSTNPNLFPINERDAIGKLLAAEVYTYLVNGGVLNKYRTSEIASVDLSDLSLIKLALESKLKGDYSAKYKTMLKHVYGILMKEITDEKIDSKHVKSILSKYTSGTSYNTVRRHLNVLFNEAVNMGMKHNPMNTIKSQKTKAVLHKPFNSIPLILEDIKTYNHKLYLCCLITYGCLLRPHREVRELYWRDFTDDLCYIKLSGNRIKSGKNRIVPVPKFVRDNLHRTEPHYNIFTNTNKMHNPDFFKTLWSRYKKQSEVLEEEQTLYSFRHSGAINIYTRTGSLTKLQKAMGHSSLNVSLTYLRGLEVPELSEEDMPKFY